MAINENRLYVLGFSHQKIPLSIREKIILTDDVERELRLLLSQKAKEFLFLETCNRFEIYYVSSEIKLEQKLLGLFKRFWSLSKESLKTFSDLRFQKEVIRHSFSVCSGLDSQILGETEITAQIKKALEEGRASNSVGKILNHLIQKSLQTSKWCRRETKISEGLVSIGNITADLANRIFGNLNQCSLLLLGAGEVAESCVQAFYRRGCNNIIIANRTLTKAVGLAKSYSCKAISLDQRYSFLSKVDVVIGSTASPEPLISHRDFSNVLLERRQKPFLAVDMGLPRNFQVFSNNLEALFLYNLDDLKDITSATLEIRKKAADQCKQYIDSKCLSTFQRINNYLAETF